ncbi:BED-type domain-containing protein [Citrus sinensis]|uniref:BED-type domain-containing protein n=1 Tax=Citrus sinensis TaxID=2711 RepID=A0ACB8HW16_CITSI|nr:BED-type domain-containing protein [Citrus sinensis]
MWKNVSRNTIKSDIMELYEMEKAKVVSLIESNNSKVAITTDMWTCGSQTKGYMAITTHFIDDSWTLRSQILRFIHVQARHTSQILCDVLLRCLMDLNLERKLSTLTVDNCTTNDRMIQLLLDKLDKNDLFMGGKLFHMRCTAHILNLIVKEGLSVISESVAKIRASVAFWTVTPQRREKFKEISRRLHQLEAQYRCLPSESECELARILSNNLKSFYNVTEWKDVNGVLTVATVLDPRYKMKLIEFYFPLLYGNESNIHIERVQMLFKELIKEYEFKAKLSVSGPSAGAFSSSIEESSVVMSHVEEQLSSRDILAIPVSTVASESAFSTCGRVVSPHRNGLHSQTVEALMCTQNWLNAYIRVKTLHLHMKKKLMHRLKRFIQKFESAVLKVWLEYEVFLSNEVGTGIEVNFWKIMLIFNFCLNFGT